MTPTFYQDGRDFYDANTGAHLASYPHPVKDWDLEGARRARVWFNQKYPEYRLATFGQTSTPAGEDSP